MHSHQTTSQRSSRRIALVFFLNLSFTVIEFIGGLLTGSTAIMADAVHDLGDSLSIGSAWLLSRWGEKSADGEFTYGYRRLSLFGALINGLVLLGGSFWVLREAIPRLANPVMPITEGMMLLAILGVLVNGAAAYRLIGGKTLNEKVLNWHLLEDVLGWVAVLIVAVLMQFTNWAILDPILSIGFTLFILANVLRNLWATGKLFFQAAPDRKIYEQIEKALLGVNDVQEIHHLHVWSLDGEHHVLTAHVVPKALSDFSSFVKVKEDIAEALQDFDLSHSTIEVELPSENCRNSF